MAKWVYLFKEGNAQMRNLLGGKGANLAEMTGLGLPVPQGFTITTEACTQYYEDGQEINDEIMGQINEYIGKMEEIVGKKFGDPAAGIRSFRCPGIHAGYDGHHSEPGSERDRSKRNRREIQQSPLGMGLLSEIYSDVL